jgi:hypothetical protein
MKHPVKTYSKTFEGVCALTVTVGTNCPKGGDVGHGGRTVFRLSDESGTSNMYFGVNGIDGLQPFERLTLLMAGDAEREMLIRAFQFALQVLCDGEENIEIFN